jgi:low affinity Fe/Cu permease
MKLNQIERVVIGIGAAAALLYLAGLTYGPLKPYQETFRIVVLVSIAVYIVYTFLLQNKESDDRAALEAQIDRLQATQRDLQNAKTEADAQLAALETEVAALRATVGQVGAAAAKPAASAAKPAASAAKSAAKPAAAKTTAAKKPAAPKPAAAKPAAAKKPTAARKPQPPTAE